MVHDDALKAELAVFDQLVRKTEEFNEEEVGVYGAQTQRRILSPLCLIPEGIKYNVNGETHVFDTAQHIFSFLAYGVSDNVKVWTRGGVMSDFVTMFGDDTGTPMKDKYGDMLGHMPQLIVKPARAQLRAAHGVKIRDVREHSCTHFDFWRPILHAKFECPLARAALLETGSLYLIDKDVCEDWTGKIVYSSNDASKDDPAAAKTYNQLRKAGKRTNGVLTGKNRIGKYLMAIRSEVRLVTGATKKRKKT